MFEKKALIMETTMNTVDINKIKPIDFISFKPGNYYHIASDKKIYWASVGDFRKGIAIAHTDEFDCLIDVNCRIIYQPFYWGYTQETRPEIIRELGGRYRETHYHDMSAPGKDSFYREWYSYINEDGSMEGHASIIPPYPMKEPYERGKVVRYENKIYDLETYKFLCEFPNRKSFHIVSDFCNGKCIIRDELYEKILLIKVDRTGKIVSCRNVTSQRQNYIPRPLSLAERSRERTLQFEQYGLSNIYADEFPCTKLEDQNRPNEIYDELEKMAKKSTLGLRANSMPGNLNDYPILYQWVTKLLLQSDKWYTCFAPEVKNGIASSGHSYRIKIISCYGVIFISFLNSSFHRAIYLFSTKGKLLNNYPYSSLIKISDRNNIYPNKKLFFNGVKGGLVVINGNGCIDEIQYIGSILENWQSPLYCYSKPNFFTDNTNNYDVSDIALLVPSEEANHPSNEDFYIKGKYYDIFLNPLKSVLVDEQLEIESVIDKYLYKTANGFYGGTTEEHPVSYSKKYGKPFRKGCIVCIPTGRCMQLTLESIYKKCKGQSPYMKVFHVYGHYDNEKQINTFVFEYRPWGEMNLKGEITYLMSPNDINI